MCLITCIDFVKLNGPAHCLCRDGTDVPMMKWLLNAAKLSNAFLMAYCVSGMVFYQSILE